jgi:hypothetical protein
MSAYEMVFTDWPWASLTEEWHVPTMNLGCHNGHWIGSDRPIMPATGWFDRANAPMAAMADQIHFPGMDMGDEETARFVLLAGFETRPMMFWYEWHVYSPDSEPVLVWPGRRSFDDFPAISWSPYGGW